MDGEDRIRAMLLERRAEVDARVARLRADLGSLTRARREESDDDEHDPEGETLSSVWSMRTGLLESALEDAAAADAAMQRLEEGRYGICEACGKPIPEGQLEARPFRSRCVACSE